MRLITLMFSLLLSVAGAFSQQFYPVKVSGNVASASVFLGDYKNPSNFRVQVSLTDITVPQISGRLLVTFSSNNYKMATPIGLPINLIGGEVYQLNESDLTQLISDLEGIPTGNAGNGGDLSPQLGSLPEGAYIISFEVIENISNLSVSNALTDFTQVVIQQNDPPLLSSPFNGSEINTRTQGNNVMFTWTPRNISVTPNQQILYELTIKQIVPVDRNPYQSMEEETYLINNQSFDGIRFPVFVYDPSNYPFEQGGLYAWQVEAYEINPVTQAKDYSRFKGAGKSEVFTFLIKEECLDIILETPIIQEPEPGQEPQEDLIVLSWSTDVTHSNYEVKYKPLGSTLPWTVVQTQEDRIELSAQELQRGETYEYTVAAQCKNWLPSHYGSSFGLGTKSCEAPTPILVESNTTEDIILNWSPSTGANSYQVTYQALDQDETQEEQIVDVTDPSITLTSISKGKYSIKVDAVCTGETAEGIAQDLDYNEQTVVGDCPRATPFNLLAIRSGVEATEAQLSWPNLSIHESYSIEYWHKDSSLTPHHTYSTTDNTPVVIGEHIQDNQLYNYILTATCIGGKQNITPVGGFRVDGANNISSPIPGTADCFPPAVTGAEAKSTTEAKFEWKKVTEAEEYQLVYYPVEAGEGLSGEITVIPGQEQFITTRTTTTIKELVESGKYNYKVRCRCGGEYSIFSEVGSVDLSQNVSGGDCDSIVDLSVSRVTETEVQLTWPYPQAATEEIRQHTGYTIEYKTEGQIWSEGYTTDLSDIETLESENINLADEALEYTTFLLSSGTTYDFRVTAKCGVETAKRNEERQATTKESEPASCGDENKCDRSSTTPRTEDPEVGDSVDVADYTMVIDTLEIDPTGDNLWKGSGSAKIEMFGIDDLVVFHVPFDGLFINDNNCVTMGNMELLIKVNLLDEETRNKIDGLVETIGAINNQLQDGLAVAGAVLDETEKAGNAALDHFQGGSDQGQVISGGLGEDLVVTSDITKNDITVSGNTITADGQSVTVTEFPALVKGGDGAVFQVNSSGDVEEVGKYNADYVGFQDEVPSTTKTLTFKANNNATYEFDAYDTRYGEAIAMQRAYLNIQGTYYSAKAITKSALDKVDFDTDETKNKIHFVNREGFEFNRSGNTITLVGGPTADAQEILAIYDDKGAKELIGALLLGSYPKVTKKLYVIPVGKDLEFELEADKIADKLNEVYGKVGITYEVEIDETFKSNAWCGGPNCAYSNTSGSGLLNNDYTGDEGKIRDAYVAFKGEDNLEADAAYLFALGSPTSADHKANEALEGKMNFGKQFGFLYSVETYRGGSAEDKLGFVAAHEVAHGNYTLKHNFDRIYLKEASKGKTTNLMDYTGDSDAIAFNKLQWDIIHDPGVVWGVFKKDADQESSLWEPKLLELITDLKPAIADGDIHDDLAGRDYNLLKGNTSVTINLLNKDRAYYFQRPDPGSIYQYMWESSEIVVHELKTLHAKLDVDNTPDRFAYWIECDYTSSGGGYPDKLAFRIGSNDVDDILAIFEFWGIEITTMPSIEKLLNDYYNEDLTHDCDHIDTYYDGIPDLVAATRSISDLEADLKSIANCSMKSSGTDEENALINIMDALGKKSPDRLLDVLLEVESDWGGLGDDESIFSLCFEGMDDIGGKDNFSNFAFVLYKYWLISKYNDQSKIVSDNAIPYKVDKTLGFYFDNYDVEGKDDKEIHNFLESDDDGYVLDDGDNKEEFHIYDEITLCNLTDIESNDLKIPTTKIPFFYLKIYDEKNHTQNVFSGSELTFDVALTFTGVGNVAKLRYLKTLTRLEKLRVVIGLVEITSGMTSILLTRLEACNATENKDFCESLNTYLFWIQMATMSSDIVTSKMIKKSASQVLDNSRGVDLDREIVDHLENMAGHGRFANAGHPLLSKFDNLGLFNITTKLDDLGSVSKARFLDEFAGASDEALIAINKQTEVLNYWNTSGTLLKNKIYAGSNVDWSITKNIVESGSNNTNKIILEAVESEALLKPLSNSKPVMAGAYCSELGGDVIVKYNLSTAEKTTFNYNNLESIIKEKIDYMNLIRQDAIDGGSLYEKLYTGVTKSKIIAAGDAASHAEVLALDALIKEMKTAGIYTSKVDLNKVSILVKGKGTWGNMCRCPHCFHLTDGVNMIGH